MFLRKSLNRKTGRTQLFIVDAYWDPKEKKKKERIIRGLGYLDAWEQEYADPIAHFKEVARQMTEEKKKAEAPVKLELNKQEQLQLGTDNRRNFGYLACSKLYHELEIN